MLRLVVWQNYSSYLPVGQILITSLVTYHL